jgi:predicted nucleotidyltransferase
MKKKYFDLSDKIEPIQCQLLMDINNVANDLNIPFFIVGATARDMFFKDAMNIKTRRATIDLGISVDNWDGFHILISNLLKTQKFHATSSPHRLLYYRDNYPIDILPFGNIMDQNADIIWPDKNKMSVLGFDDAFKDSYRIRIQNNPTIEINIASPAGLATMKLISAKESFTRLEKDAQDFEMLLSNYADVGNIDRLYDEHLQFVEMGNYDLTRAGAMLLGMDVASIVSENTAVLLKSILVNETDTQNINNLQLVAYMIKNNSAESNDFEYVFQLLKDFLLGFMSNR